MSQLLLLLHSSNEKNLFFKTTWIIWYQKGKASLDLNEARDDGVFGSSGIGWTICKQSALCSTQITTPTPHHSDALPDAQLTVSKHCRPELRKYKNEIHFARHNCCNYYYRYTCLMASFPGQPG